MMPRRLRRFYALALSIGVGATLLGLSLVVPVVSTTTDFSIYNSGWNGTSRLAVKTYKAGVFVPTLALRSSGTEVDPVVRSLSAAGVDPARGTIIIIGPSKGFSKADGAFVQSFLANGGLVVLADDFGTGNSLLGQLNTTSRFTGKLVIDLAFEKKPEFAVAYNFYGPHELLSNVSLLLLNYPTAIIPSRNATVLATTSSASWMDMDGDEFRDSNEPAGPFPLLTVERVGKGTLVLLSDPSVLINSMSERLDNGVFVDNLLAFASKGRSQVLIDESHRNFFDPIGFSVSLSGRLSDGAKLGAVLLAVAVFFMATTDIVPRTWRLARRSASRAWRALSRVFSREPTPRGADTFMSDEELLEKVLERHPDWKRGVLARLIRLIDRHGAVEE